MQNNKYKNKIIAAGILTAFIFYVGEVPIVQAAPVLFGEKSGATTASDIPTKTVPQTQWGVAAILVESGLMQEDAQYTPSYLPYSDKLQAKTIGERVRRYAADVQSAQEYTKSLIIKIVKNAKTEDIAAMLEKLYREGDSSKDEKNRLIGAVIIGDVPLPVVNKKGNRFVSMLPYTDFDDKTYIFDAASGDFSQNAQVSFPKADIWHGVIQPPLRGNEGRKLLANYFDKNHLYHLGIKEFSDFATTETGLKAPKIFMADLVNEFKSMNKEGFAGYIRYLTHWEDFSYQRFTKFLADKFMSQNNKQLKDEGLTDDQLHPSVPCDKTCVILKNSRALDFDMDGYPNGYELFAGIKLPVGNKATNPKNPFSFPMDFSKGPVPFPRLDPFPMSPKFWVDDGSKLDYPDPDSATEASAALNTLPDIQSKRLIMNFTKRYVELFDKFLANMNNYADATGRYKVVDKDTAGANRSDIHSMPALISIKDEYTSRYLKLVNNVLERKIDEFANKLQSNILLLAESKISGTATSSADSLTYPLSPANFVNFATHKEGTSPTLWINGKQITTSENIKSVLECNLYRGSDDGTGKNTQMTVSLRTFNPLVREEASDAGCRGSNSGRPARCFPSAAKAPLFDSNGTRQVPAGTVPDSAVNHRSCFDFKEKTRFEAYKKEVDEYGKKVVEKKNNEDEIAKIPLPASPYQSAENIILFDKLGLKITFADVLNKFGLIDGKDNDGDGAIDNAAEGDPKYGIPGNDWQQIGERLLKTTKSYTFQGDALKGVKKMNLEVEALPVKDLKTGAPIFVPSIIFHKEPTPETIEAQKKSGVATSLPVDNPRHVTFQDKTGNFRKIMYPNAFGEKSHSDFLSRLKNLENELKEIAGTNGFNADNPATADYVPIEGSLSQIVSGGEDIFDPVGGKKNALLKASAQALADAFTWRDANIDEKHEYVFEKYIGAAQNPFIDKIKNGYEALYLVGSGTPDRLQMRFNGDFPREETDSQYLANYEIASLPPATSPDDTSTEISKEAGAEKKSEDSIIITEWFQEITKWLKETTTKLSGTFPTEAVCKLSDKEDKKTGAKMADKTASTAAGSEAFGVSKSAVVKEKSTSGELKSVKSRAPVTKEKITLVTYQKKQDIAFLKSSTEFVTENKDDKEIPVSVTSKENKPVQKKDTASGVVTKDIATKQDDKKITFNDLDPKSEGFTEVMKLVRRGVLEGYNDGSFKPNQPITREEFTKVNLYANCIYCTKFPDNIKRSVDTVYQKQPFPDKNFTPALLYCVKDAKNRQIVSGYQGGNQKGFFVPRAPISRAEATKVILETARQNPKNRLIFIQGSLVGKPWYANYVLTAQKELLYPNSFKNTRAWLEAPMTRVEFAIMAAKFIERFNCLPQADQKLSQKEKTPANIANPENADLGFLDSQATSQKKQYTDGEDSVDNKKPSKRNVYSKTDTADKTNKEDISSIEFLDSIPADSNSALVLKASVLNKNGDVDKTVNDKIMEFKFTSPEFWSFARIEPELVKTKEGVAYSVLYSTKKAGEIGVTAALRGKTFASEEKPLSITPLEPAKIAMTPKSSTINSGGLSTTNIHTELKDTNDNLVNDGSYTLTFMVDGPGFLDAAQDEDTKKEGIQMTSVNGMYDIILTSKTTPGNITVKGVFSAPKSFSLVPLESSTEEKRDTTLITGQTVVQSRPEIIMALPVGISTVAKTSIESTKLAKKIIVTASKKTITADDSVELTAKLHDSDNNFTANDNKTFVEFRLTEGTKRFGAFEGSTLVKAKNGVAKIKLRATGTTGLLHIVVSSPGLQGAALELESVKTLRAEKLKEISPHVLFVSMLGAAFGNIFQENYFGGWFVFSGTTQSVISLLSETKPSLRLVDVSATGKITIFDPDTMKLRVITGQESAKPNRFIISDSVTAEDIAEVFMIAKPQNKATIVPENTPPGKEGVFVTSIAKSGDYSFRQLADGVSVLKSDNEALRVFHSGSIKIVNSDFALQLAEETNESGNDGGRFLTLKVVDKATDVAKITFAYSFDKAVRQLPENFVFDERAIYENGVNMRLLSSKGNLRFENTFSGNSSQAAGGLAIVDSTQELPKSQAPGLNYVSLEASPSEQGIGFQGQNKHMLLFAAGNSVGEANMPYSSEIGVVLGDPTVRINNKINVSRTGFTKDIGKEVYFGDVPIKTLIASDYNSDGLKDIFIGYEDGKIRLLQNNKGYPRFIDKGIFMDIPGGITGIATPDINQDGWEDFIIASKESCRKGEICVSEYENHNGNFHRKYLPLKPFTDKNRIHGLQAADLNNDGYPDLVVSDDAGDIWIFYNKKGQIDPNGQKPGSLGIHIDQKANLKTEVLVAYDGMPKKDDKNFIDLNLSETGITQSFLYLDLDSNLVTSEKRAQDMTPPRSVIALNDQIEYTLTFKNTGPKDLKNFMFSDVFPSNMDIQKENFRCLDCGVDKLQFMETGQNVYSYVISGLTLSKGKTRTITYTGTVKSTPKVKIIVGKKLSALYAPLPGYAEIGATPDGNTSGRMTFFYPKTKDALTGQMTYNTFVSPPPEPPKLPKALTNPLGDILPSKDGFKDLSNEGRAEVIGKIGSLLAKETPAEKSSDSLNADDVEDAIQNFVNAQGCGKGCIPLPVNFSFLTPGTINAFGVPAGFDPGIPVFGWGVPSIWPLWPISPYQGSLGGRIYLSPTLTGSLGMGICLGPYLAAQCYAFKIADLLPKGVCAAIQKTIESGLAKANNFIKEQGSTAMVASGETADSSGRTATGGMAGSTTLGSYQYKATASTNFRIPGFPQVITKWFEDQVAEIVNKLTDLPDFYFIYPDPTSLVGSFIPQEGARQGARSGQNKALSFPAFSAKPLKYSEKGFKAVLSTPGKLLSFFNSIPLIQVEAREVAIKIPALTAAEIEKIRRDAEQWEKDFKEEIQRVKEVWSCDKDSKYQTLCDKLTLDSGALFSDLEKNLAILEKYKTLPRKILAWKNVLGKYLYQIICYMDAIMQYFGGYFKKQQTRALTWIDAIRKVKEMLQTWKLMLDVMVDYQASCDKCSSSRFSLLELLLRVFAIIPSPPIVPFPKWPDIYLDLSKVQLGLRIPFPDVRFIPERVIFPKLPRITFPDVPSAAIEIALPQMPLLPDLPDLNFDLPDLPPLPLPALPDIPPPPKIPALPNQIKTVMLNLKKLIKILCLLRKGLISVPELTLKTQVEYLTERGLTPLLPLDIGAKLQLPPIKYDFLDRVEITGTTNLKLQLNYVYDFVKNIADELNEITTDVVKSANKSLKEGGKILKGGAEIIDTTVKKVVPKEDIKVDFEKKSSKAGGLRAGHDIDKDIHLVATQRFLAHDDPLLNRSPEEIKRKISTETLSGNDINKKLAATRDALITYVDEQNSRFGALEKIKDGDGLTRMIAQMPRFNELIKKHGGNMSPETPAESRYLAALSVPQHSTSSLSGSDKQAILNVKLVDENLTSFGEKLKDDAAKRSKLLAAESGVTDVASAAKAPDIQEKGIFIMNQDLGVNERLIAYTDEADQPSQLLFVDMDNDGDQEIAYSFGSNVYLKENYKSIQGAVSGMESLFRKLPPMGPIFPIGGEPIIKDMAAYLPATSAINNFEVTSRGNNTVELAWNAAAGDITGYEITYAYASGENAKKITVPPDKTTLSLSLPNGFYYATIRSFDKNGKFSNASDTILLAPSVCLDKSAPFPNGGPPERTVPIFKTLTVDASKSFDTSGKILQYFIDLDPDMDSDKDGNTTNDKNLAHGFDDPVFKLGPYADLNDRKVVLNVIDEALNRAQQSITIHVTVPEITLDKDSIVSGTIKGKLNPPESEMPVSVIRDRGGVLTALKTKSANGKGKYLTDANGEFKIADLNLNNVAVLKNEKGEIIAEINRKTANVAVKDNRYRAEILPAEQNGLPTRTIIKRNPPTADQNIMAAVFLVTKAETAADIKEKDIHILYEEELKAITGADFGPFSAVITRQDIGGDNVSDSEKLRFGRSTGQKLLLPYSDVAASNPYYKDIFRLWLRRVFEGIPRWNKALFEPEKSLTRAEFAHIMLKTFCIIPRREAYEEPSSFSDIAYNKGKLPWYYGVVKEAYFQGFITGYKGEVDKKTGKTPFKSEANITRAEATKIILEALEKKGVISMGRIAPTEPYYIPYLKIAQNLTPYFKEKSNVRTPFILTKEEAARPNQLVSRGAFIAMANRVLTAYDCSIVDGDNDGMPDYFELQNGLNPEDPGDANQDPDKDGLTNLEEYHHGTDPHNPDTDGGGVNDGDEVKNGTDPLDPKDDFNYLKKKKIKRLTPDKVIDFQKDLEEGVYLIQKQCLSCPCPITLEYTADLMPGDRIFAVISSDDNFQIFSKSNEAEKML